MSRPISMPDFVPEPFFWPSDEDDGHDVQEIVHEQQYGGYRPMFGDAERQADWEEQMRAEFNADLAEEQRELNRIFPRREWLSEYNPAGYSEYGRLHDREGSM